MSRLPTLFVSHGAPTLAIEPGSTGPMLGALGRELPLPKAILVVSAHWETAAPEVSAANSPETIHDFWGFPRPLYSIQYRAPGAPALARRVKDLLDAAALPAKIDPRRGLDHGAWVPLLFMYPSADVPVAQLSIQTHLGVQHHYALGCALAPLAEEGVLIVGSGSITHNLQEVFGGGPRPVAPEYVDAFRDWIAERLASEDVESLLDYRRRAPDAARAHPTEGHFVPLLFALGAAGSHARATRLHDEVTFGVIGMDAYAFGAPVVRPVATEGVGSAAGS